MFNALILDIKRQKTPFHANLYRLIKGLRAFSFPSVYVIHKPLYTLSRMLINGRWHLQQILWSVPVFKTQCVECGSGLRLPNGMPWIDGNPEIKLGNNVSLAKCMIAAGHIYDTPMLEIGDNTKIGYNTTISVNKHIKIGNNVLIALECFIADSDGHPTDPIRRHGSLLPEEIKPIVIEDNVWIAKGVSILKGVTIGENSIVGTSAVVTKDVPPNTIVSGNPAVVVKTLENVHG